MEHKVKDQLEAANPEPVIEEVVSGFVHWFEVLVFKHDAIWRAPVFSECITTSQKFGIIKISPVPHLLDQKYSNIPKMYYNAK